MGTKTWRPETASMFGNSVFLECCWNLSSKGGPWLEHLESGDQVSVDF